MLRFRPIVSKEPPKVKRKGEGLDLRRNARVMRSEQSETKETVCEHTW
jgi:hypothetical protein